jgi:hypothetical protein
MGVEPKVAVWALDLSFARGFASLAVIVPLKHAQLISGVVRASWWQ